MKRYFSEETNFFKGNNPEDLLAEYGSPLYVYSEEIFRQRCREMAHLVDYENFKVTYSIKANSNLTLLKIAREEGLHADAMSPGEIYVLGKAGFTADEIFYISNNVSREEMKYAIDKNIMVSVDSLSQLDLFGQLNPGGKVCVRLNTGVGAGHHEKVITGGKETKFGINSDKIDEIKTILKSHHLILSGLNQHIGSLFMDGNQYIAGVISLLQVAEMFDDLEFIDFGGGFGISYSKQDDFQKRLELEEFGKELGAIFKDFSKKYGKDLLYRSEPGRYISAESSILLGNVYSKKWNGDRVFVGTDLGFNVLIRPAMYDSHHDVEIYRGGSLLKESPTEIASIVGNICESGDIMVKNRELPIIKEGDIVGVMDAGAYGYSMSSNYNNRLRPAEILIRLDGKTQLIRRRDTLEDLVRNFEIE
ncbi:MAG: diaminopimelate decarboxylase [Peptostreptococcales bacterium]|jgi:diaminopimelate decarboxylase